MRACGYLRFSFLGRNDTRMYRRHGASTEAFGTHLFDPDRLAKRFHLFEQICLPALRNQSDADFRLVVVTSDLLPAGARDRLTTLLADVPQARLVSAPEMPVTRAIQPEVRTMVTADEDNTVHFRIDDDDALPRTYIEQLKTTAARAEPETIITYPRGYALFRHEGRAHIAPDRAAWHAYGWARVNAPGDLRCPFHFAHGNAANRFASIVDPRPVGYMCGLHDTADTVWRQSGRIAAMLEAAEQPGAAEAQPQMRREVDEAFPWIGYDGFLDAMQSLPD